MIRPLKLFSLGMLLLSCTDVSFVQIPSVSSETFFQTGTPARLDILIVVDNSKSMSGPQKKMAEKMSSFINEIEKVNWQMAVTTTDVSDGVYGLKGEFLPFDDSGLKILTQKVPQFRKKFIHAIYREESINPCSGDCPSQDERALESVYLAIEKSKNQTQKLFRKDTDFVVIVLSNEDEGSDGRGQSLVTPKKLLNKFDSVFPNKTMQLHGIIVLPGDRDCKRKQGWIADYGEFVYRMADLTNGLATSICSEDYGKELRSIGQKPRDLANVFFLDKEPYLPSVKLQIYPKPDRDIPHSIKGTKLSFAYPPPLHSTITVTYIPLENLEEDEPQEDLIQ